MNDSNDSSDYPVHAVALGYCRSCAQPVRTDSFRDALSHREYQITATCQRCQDAMFLGGSDRDPPTPSAVRHGTIVGAVLEGASAREVALLPFEFVVRHARIEWEPRHIVRAGAALEPVDPWVELGAMHDAWAGHYLRIVNLASFADPLLSVRLSSSDLVIALDRLCVAVTAHLCPSVTLPPPANLSADVPWSAAFDAPLLPLDVFLRAHALDGAVGTRDACRGSALRQCALLARLLALRATEGVDVGRTAFELLLRAHAGRFEPSFQEGSDAAA